MRGQKKAFTLTEILVVVIIIAVITGFGIPNYYKSQERTLAKSAASQLRILHRAQELYFTKYDFYYPADGDGNEGDLNVINDVLNIHIIANGFLYECQDTDDGVNDPTPGPNLDSTYVCIATREGGVYTVEITRSWDNIGSEYVEDGPTCIAGLQACPVI